MRRPTTRSRLSETPTRSPARVPCRAWTDPVSSEPPDGRVSDRPSAVFLVVSWKNDGSVEMKMSTASRGFKDMMIAPKVPAHECRAPKRVLHPECGRGIYRNSLLQDGSVAWTVAGWRSSITAHTPTICPERFIHQPWHARVKTSKSMLTVVCQPTQPFGVEHILSHHRR